LQLKQDKMENFKIVSEKTNILFERKEIKATVYAEITPSKQEVEKLLIEKLPTTLDVLKLERIKGKFGSKTFEITAKVYKSKEDKENIERKTKQEIEAEKKVVEETKKAEEEAKKIEQEKKEAEEEEKAEEPKVKETPSKEIGKVEEIKPEKKLIEEVKKELNEVKE